MKLYKNSLETKVLRILDRYKTPLTVNDINEIFGRKLNQTISALKRKGYIVNLRKKGYVLTYYGACYLEMLNNKK